MNYLCSLLLFVVALVLGVLGIAFRLIDLDIVALICLVLAAILFLYSSLHLSLRIRPRSQRGSGDAPRNDREQSRLLGLAIFRRKDDLSQEESGGAPRSNREQARLLGRIIFRHKDDPYLKQ